MSKIALINPGIKGKKSTHEPINLGYIASYLELHNKKVKIFDEFAKQNVKKEIIKFSPDIIGITGTTMVINRAYQIADWCREQGFRTVIGGVHASVLPNEALQHCDIVVKGEGEKAMLDIANNNIEKGIASNPYIKNLDEIPIPARHLMNMDYYTHAKDNSPYSHLFYVPYHTKIAAVMTSRGCPFRCTFCHNTWKEMPVRFHSLERIIEEIKLLIDNYGIEALWFFDDDIFSSKANLKKICEKMISEELNLIWGTSARVDTINYDIAKLAKQAGCKELMFGFESGSQRILDVLNKKTTVEQNKKAIELCNKLGIMACGTFMIGNPTETLEDIKLTQQFIKENNKYLHDIGVLSTTPYPGTELWKWCEEHNLIPKNIDWSKLRTNEVSILANENITIKKAEKLVEETMDMIVHKTPISFSNLVKSSLKQPLRIVKKILGNPTKVFNAFRRIE